MSAPVIRVENLGKCYTLKHQGQGQRSGDGLRHALQDALTAPFRRRGRKSGIGNRESGSEEFWALKDVSFEVHQGEVLGIIGRNGAGKSTLLKILSRITEPTTGRIGIKGRVASLLEVGTGFHPELTGRENIFLNGAILGMSRAEVKRKFDEIVDFSGVEKFLDTPVKRYSSGMYVRLAFAVAAHLEPEILIIDEVLAVGDAEFQKKCLGKMRDVATGGRTVIFVSHNINAVQNLCTTGLLLERGAVKTYTADLAGIVRDYCSPSSPQSGTMWEVSDDSGNNDWFRLERFYLTDVDGSLAKNPMLNNRPFSVRIEGVVTQLDRALSLGIALIGADESTILWSYQTDAAETSWIGLTPGRWRLELQLPSRLLNEGDYRVRLIGGLHNRLWIFSPDSSDPSLTLVVRGGLSDSSYWQDRRPGLLAPGWNWIAEPLTEVTQRE